MATQTRRTIRRSAKFFRATVKAYIVMVLYDLILLGISSSYAALTQNGVISNGMALNAL